MIERLALGLAISLIVSVAGWRANALTLGGALAALGVGTAVIVGLSWPGALLLGFFFVSSSGLSRLARPTRIAAKGGRRDEWQVLANGGVAALAALLALWIDPLVAYGMFAGALAAATADTWATEVGSRARVAPRLLLSRCPVLPGESGGVTRLGTLGSLGGAALVGLLAGVLAGFGLDATRPISLAAIVMLAGIVGSLADSLLGERLQARRWCPICGEPTERRFHACGTATELVGGLGWLGNDAVNLACTLVGALLGSLVALTV